MRVGVYPGTFDPVTLGHLDIIERGARLFDRLVIGVTTNASKSPMFSLAERMAMMADAAAAIGDHVSVAEFGGLVVDFARAQGAVAIVRGLRSGTDYDYEQQMAAMNRRMAPEVETIFLVADGAVQPISSTLVKEIGRAKGQFAQFVTPAVHQAVAAKLGAA